MPGKKLSALNEAPVWIGSFDVDIEEKCICLPFEWRPAKPLSLAWLLWKNEEQMHVMKIGLRMWMDEWKSGMRENEGSVLQEGNFVLNPDGRIHLPDAFLEGLSDFSCDYVVFKGMYRYIEIYTAEGNERMEADGKALLDELLQELTEPSQMKNKRV